MAIYKKFKINGLGCFSGKHLLGWSDSFGAWYLCIVNNATGLIEREYDRNFNTLGYFDMQAALDGARRATRWCPDKFDFKNIEFVE